MTPRSFRSGMGLVAVVGALSACSTGWTMERARPVASSCPEQALPSTASAPDTTVLRWYRTAETRDVELASAWCGTVGEPVLSFGPSPSFSRWEAGRDLEVWSWNVNLGAGSVLSLLRDEAGLVCTPDGPEGTARVDPFVLLLQEAWRRSDRLPPVPDRRLVPWTFERDRGDEADVDVVELARRCGLSLVYVPSARNGPATGAGGSEDKGNAILSSLPLTTPIAIDLPFEAGRKVAVAATVVAPGGERVRVVSAHLDVASTLYRTLVSGNQTRARQVAGLVEGLDLAERDGPLNAITVVGGDFNSWAANESALKRMREAFPESPEWDGQPTWRPLGLPLDHVFFRRGPFDHISVDGYGRLSERYGSDHHPRTITVRYDAAAATTGR